MHVTIAAGAFGWAVNEGWAVNDRWAGASHEEAYLAAANRRATSSQFTTSKNAET